VSAGGESRVVSASPLALERMELRRGLFFPCRDLIPDRDRAGPHVVGRLGDARLVLELIILWFFGAPSHLDPSLRVVLIECPLGQREARAVTSLVTTRYGSGASCEVRADLLPSWRGFGLEQSGDNVRLRR